MASLQTIILLPCPKHQMKETIRKILYAIATDVKGDLKSLNF
jgi:hypothetical protein